ncbi:MAG: hypothetical protein NTX43_02910 [Bacteroidetes bacterium]|nr:hypothetical protein [Bacteroidota bacterium]
MDKRYFDINLDIVSKLKVPERFLEANFDINLDIVSKLQDFKIFTHVSNNMGISCPRSIFAN